MQIELGFKSLIVFIFARELAADGARLIIIGYVTLEGADGIFGIGA